MDSQMVGRVVGASAAVDTASRVPPSRDAAAARTDPELLAARSSVGTTGADSLVHQTIGGRRQTFARFVVDPKTHEVSVQIVDADSQEVIRSIPGDELKQMARTYRAASGFVLDSTA